MDRAALGYLRKATSLSVGERPVNRDLRVDPVDPAVGLLVAVQAVICVDSVEFEPDVDSGQPDLLVVRVQAQGYRETGRQCSEEELILPDIRPRGSAR